MSALPSDSALLAALLRGQELLRAELAAVRSTVEALARRPADGPAQADTELVIAIRQHVGNLLFTAAELLEHARLLESAVLAAAIVASCGALNGRKLGQFLKRMEGVPCDGLEIARISSDRDGAIWRVLEIANPPPL